MGRYRSPPPARSNYITTEGKQKLQQELNYLWTEKRPRITRSVTEAAAQGDRSENAEYIYGKKQLREIDAHVRFLQKRLASLTVVSQPPQDKACVYFGAWVTLRDEQGLNREYRIVGPDEFDHASEYISMDAPLAVALLKRRLNDAIEVKLPTGLRHYQIMKIRY